MIGDEQLEAAWRTQIDPIKGADLHFVEDAKHFVMLDQPDVFDKLLDTALAIILRDAGDKLIARCDKLLAVLRSRAREQPQGAAAR